MFQKEETRLLAGKKWNLAQVPFNFFTHKTPHNKGKAIILAFMATTLAKNV